MIPLTFRYDEYIDRPKLTFAVLFYFAVLFWFVVVFYFVVLFVLGSCFFQCLVLFSREHFEPDFFHLVLCSIFL